jgi:hypothetical protein
VKLHDLLLDLPYSTSTLIRLHSKEMCWNFSEEKFKEQNFMNENIESSQLFYFVEMKMSKLIN